MPNPLNKLPPWTPGFYVRGGLRAPLKADFPTVIGTTAITDKINRCTIAAASGLVVNCVLRPLSAPPYTIDFVGSPYLTGIATNQVCAGIFLSDATKYRGYYVGIRASQPEVTIDSWTNSTNYSANVTNAAGNFGPFAFLRITDDGTTRKHLASANGLDYNLFYSEATNTFVAPTQVGFGLQNQNSVTSSATQNIAVVYHFLVTPRVLSDAP